MSKRFVRSRTIDAPELGLSAVTLASERTSNAFSGTGWDSLTVYFDLTARSASTALICKLEVSHDRGTTWAQIKSESIAAGTGTLSAYSQSFANTAAALLPCRFDIDDDFLRIKVSGTSGAAGDVATVKVRLSKRG